MKLFRQLALLLIGLVTIYSCSEDDFDRAPLLTLSEEALDFAREADLMSIDVTINDGDEFFHAVNADATSWLSVKQTQGKLEVSVMENTTSGSRIGTIEVLIRKGNLTKSVTVTQSGDSGYLNLPEDTFIIPNIGGEITAYVKSNAKWVATIEGDAPWLTINEQSKGKLIVSASDNIEVGRTASIRLTAPGVSDAIVNIIQRGVIYYDFPYLNIAYLYDGPESERGIKYKNSFGDAHTFEKARGSVLYENSSIGAYYQTRSTLFPIVGYGGYSAMGTPFYPSVKLVSITCSIQPFEVLEDPVFIEYMLGEGFEFAWRNDADEVATYWNPETQIAIQFINYDGPLGNRVTFGHAKTKPNDPTNQVDSYPTFTEMPEVFSKYGGTTEEIIAWEEARGSVMTVDASTPTVLVFVPDQKQEPYCMERVYFMSSDSPATLETMKVLVNHLDKAFYFSGDIYDKITKAYILTSEFQALMEQEGYVVYQVDDKMAAFYHADKNLILIAYVAAYTAEGRLPRLTFDYMLM